MNDVTRERLWRFILMMAIAFLAAAWVGFAITMTTGLEFKSHSHFSPSVATEEDYVRVRHIAVLTTVFAGPIALWAAMMRKRTGSR